MVRSLWIAAVVVALAGTGLAWAQSSAPGAVPRDGFIIVREEGRPPQRCKILKTWCESNGVPAFQVQAVHTGELMTILVSGPAPAGQQGLAMATRIFRWGPYGQAPTGSPVPPPTAIVMGAPLGRPAPQTATPLAIPQPAPLPVRSQPSLPARIATTPPPTPLPVRAQPSLPSRIATTPPPAPLPLQSQPSLPSRIATTPPPAPLPVITRKPDPAPVVTRKPDPTPVLTRKPDPNPIVTREPRPTLVANAAAPILPQPFTPIPTISSDKKPLQNLASGGLTPPAQAATGGLRLPPAGLETATKPIPTVVTPIPTNVAKTIPATPAIRTTPPVTPAITPAQARKPEMCDCTPPGTMPQPRLVPSAQGTVCPTPCNCCCQSSCVNCTPPMRQSWISRIFKSNTAPTAVAASTQTSKPPTATAPPKAVPVVKVATVPAQPGNWRESWGKVEPWKSTPPASAERTVNPPAQRVARTPLPMDPPQQPDPLKDPDWFRSITLQEKLPHSKVPETPVSSVASRGQDKPTLGKSIPAPLPSVRPSEMVATARPTLPSMPSARPVPGITVPVPNGAPMAAAPAPTPTASAAMPVPGQVRGRGIELPANEGNAFWTPPTAPPPPTQPAPKYNAFQRDDGSPPPMGGAPAMAADPRGPMPMGGPPQNGPPMGPMPLMPPRPPMPPPIMDSGVPSGMSNAFTMTSTRRPIPADFGPTPQEPNGFGDAVPYVPGPARPVMPPRSPMLPPSPGMLGTLQPPVPPMSPMPNGVAMMPRPMAAINPLMAVPIPVASSGPAVPSGAANVPQMLATLKDSLYPSQREWAVEQLSELNWHLQPEVVRSLAKYAKEDPAATVRAACVHTLARMKVNTIDVVAVVQELKNDPDPRVRHEADAALNAIGVAGTPHQDSAVQPASHR